ncbi:MAG TPA: J domain-containing protein [Sphingomonadales bacterium]
MRNLYSILGVPKTASAAEIKKAYRKLAKELHPDLHPGDQKIAERFKEVSAAYAILGDEKQRARYDRGEIDENGVERGYGGFQNAYRQYQRAGAGARGRGFEGGFEGGFGGGFSGFSAEDLFSDIFSNLRQGGGRRPTPSRGADRIYEVTIDFMDAVKGTKRRISLENGRTLNVTIPKGVREGQQIRLKGQGGPGVNGGPSGDALIEVKITPHPRFRREGNDIHVDLPITLAEAVLGGQVRVPTIDGAVNMTIPAGSNTGKIMRLKGRGAEGPDGVRGDQYVKIQVMLPDVIDDELRKAIEAWSRRHSYEVRDEVR